MNTQDAKKVLDSLERDLESRSYAYWKERVEGEPECFELKSELGIPYQIEIEAFWDDKAGGDIKVSCTIDDGGIRAYSPLSRGILVRREGG